MGRGFFIAGTDTDIGKTVITGLLSHYLSRKGLSVITQKWVQTGTRGYEDDIFFHLRSMGLDQGRVSGLYDLMVPYSFKLPASPHLASSSESIEISSTKIRDSFLSLCRDFDVVIVEGSGGLLVPFTGKSLMIDIARSLDLEVVLVVGNRLGAINHALLSIEALKSRNMKAVGLIFNRFSPDGEDQILTDNRSVIASFSGLSDLGELIYEPDPALRPDLFLDIGEKVFKYCFSDERGKVSEKGSC